MGQVVRHYRRRLGASPGQLAGSGPQGTPTLVITRQPPVSVQDRVAVASGSEPVVQLQDGNGNNVQQSNVNITAVSGRLGVVVAPSVVQTDATGKATFTNLTLSGSVGSLTILFTAPGFSQALSNSINLTAGTPNPANFTAVVPNPVTQNQVRTVTVQARDADGNACTAASNTVVENVNGANIHGGTTTNNNNGTYSCTETPANLGNDTVSVTADGTAITGSPFASQVQAPANVSRPNEPAGFTRFAEVQFTGTNGTTALNVGARTQSGFGILAGSWVQFNANPAMTVINDATAPASPSPCLQYLWPTGLNGGLSNGQLIGWDATQSKQYSRIYEATWFKIPSANLEMPASGEMKLLGYWGSGAAGLNGSDVYSVIGGSNFGNNFTLTIRMQNIGANWTVGGNLTPAVISCNQWTRLEILMTTSDLGVTNGQLDVWLNGVHTHNYHAGNWPLANPSVAGIFRNSANPNKFYQRHWDPVWGGGGGTKTRNDTMLIDHIYLSGVV